MQKKWEKYANQGELTGQQKLPQKKRKQNADSLTIPHPQKRARTSKKAPSPLPNTFSVEVPTCHGIVVLHLPVIPGELETPREMRIYDASEPYIHAASREEVSRILAARQGTAPALSLPVSTPVAALSPAIVEEWAGGAPTPTIASTPLPDSPAALRARSLSPLLFDWPHGAATPLACLRSPLEAPPAVSPLPDNWSDGANAEMDL